LGVGAVAVLGHPEYYPRFGFRPASQWGIKCEYDVPEEVFMLMELSPAYLQDYQRTIRYHAAFADI
jgi:putative acetyltransferase